MSAQEQLESDFDEELQKMHDKWQISEKRMKDKYEEEVNTVLEENERMEEELTEIKRKMAQSENVTESLQKELAFYQSTHLHEEDNATPTATKRRSCDVALRKVIENKTKVETELVSQKMQVRKLEYDNKNIRSQLEQVQQEADLERDHQQQLRYKATNLRTEMDIIEQKLDDQQQQCESLHRERDASHAQVELLKKELKDMKVQKEQLETWQDIAEIMSNDKKNLMEKVELLNAEVKEIQVKRDEIIKEKLQLSEEETVLTNQLEEFRREIGQHKADYDKVKNDYEWLQSSKLEQSARLDDLQTSSNEITKEKERLEDQLEKANDYSESLKVTVEELNGDIAKYKMEKEEEGKQQQVVITQLQEQNETLTEQHSSLKQELQAQQLKTDELLEGQRQLLSKHEEMYNSLAAEIEDLKSKLKLTLEELGRARSLLDEKTEKCATVSDMETQLEEIESQLVAVTQQHQMGEAEMEELKNETVILKLELANAHTEIQDACREYEVKQQESEKKLKTLEHSLRNEIKDMLEVKGKLERDFTARLTEAQTELDGLRGKLESSVVERTSVEEELDKVRIDLKNTENELLEASSVKEDLSERLETVTASKEDISEKLAFALQKLEEVSLSRYQPQSKQQSAPLEGGGSEVDGGGCGGGNGVKSQDIPLAVVEPDNHQSSSDLGTFSAASRRVHRSSSDFGTFSAASRRIETAPQSGDDEDGGGGDDGDGMEQPECLLGTNQILIESGVSYEEQTLGESGYIEERMTLSCQNEIQKDDQLQHQKQYQKVLQENWDLRQQLESKQKEILQLQHDVTVAQLSTSSIQTQLTVGTLVRNSIENKHNIPSSPVCELNQCDQYGDEVQNLVPQQNGNEDGLEDLKKVKNILAKAGKELKLYKQRLDEEKAKNKLLVQNQNQLKQEMQKMQKAMIYTAWQQHSSNQTNSNKCDVSCANSDIHQLHKEITDLKMALFAANERQEIQQRKYEDRKLRIRAKFLRARQLYSQEKTLMKEQLCHLGEDLLVTRSMFNKERELREEREASYKKLTNERRELFSKNGEQVEIIRELTRSQSRLEVQSKFLEDENRRLQEKLIAANHRQSLSQRAHHNLIYPNQLTSTKSLCFDSIF